jgi:hypothetical protein
MSILKAGTKRYFLVFLNLVLLRGGVHKHSLILTRDSRTVTPSLSRSLRCREE